MDSERFFYGCYYQPERLLINFFHCTGNGLTKYFYYDSRIYVTPGYQKQHPTVLEYDDSIRSKGIAYAIAGSFVGTSRGLGNVSPATNTAYAYLFDKSGAGTVALFSKDKANHSIQLSGSGWKAFDLMGNPLPVASSRIVFGRTPIYVQADGLSTSALGAAFQSATVSDLPDTTPPNLSLDEFPAGPTSRREISFRWLGIDDTYVPSAMNPNYVTYSYKLEGRDADWSPWTAATHLSLISLASGDYVFQVRARDAAGNISATESRPLSVRGSIAPPRNIRIGNP
jgi:hypothetical protein